MIISWDIAEMADPSKVESVSVTQPVSALNISDTIDICHSLKARREHNGQNPELRSLIDSLVILDRAVDLISPLPTQLTYEGLGDEMFGITCATVNIPEPEKKTLSLTSQEELFQELRGLNFNAVGPTLSRKARGIKAMEDQRHEAKTPRLILHHF